MANFTSTPTQRAAIQHPGEGPNIRGMWNNIKILRYLLGMPQAATRNNRPLNLHI